MEFIILVLIIAFFSVGMMASYIPYSLHHIAEKAGLGKFSFQYLALKLQKVPVKDILLKYDELTNLGYQVDFASFTQFYKKNPDRFYNVVKILSLRKSNTHNLSFSELIEFNLREDQVSRLSEIVQLSKDRNVFLTKDEIARIAETKFNLLSFFDILEKSIHFKTEVKSINITDQSFESHQKWMDLIEAVNKNEDTSNISFFKNDQISLNLKIEVLEAFIKLSERGLNPKMDELISLSTVNANLTSYVNALILIHENTITDIDPVRFKNHSLKRGNPENIANAFVKLKNKDIQTNPDLLFESEISKPNFNHLIDVIINPFDVKVEPALSIILADGFQIAPEITLSLRYTVDCLKQEPDLKQLFKSVNSIAYDKLCNYKAYQEVLNDLNKVSNNIQFELQGLLSDTNQHHILLESVKITDIEIVADKLLAAKELETFEKENSLKREIAEDKKKFRDDLDRAYKNGEISYNEYQKEKYIFNSDDDSDLPYHTT
jgi:hypothetical protein